MTNFWLRDKFVPRSLRNRLRTKSCTVTNSWSPASLYRDYASTLSKLYHDGKNRAVLRSLQAYKNRDENDKSCQRLPVDSATFTNAHRRAVSSKTLNPRHMNQRLAYITLLVDDYDKAIGFYTGKLNFELIEDTIISGNKRWVLVRPNGQSECCILLAKASNKEQSAFIGNQTGGRVFLFLFTDNFNRDYQNLIENNITIEREPRDEPYGKVAVFRDIYGNLWDLIQPTT